MSLKNWCGKSCARFATAPTSLQGGCSDDLYRLDCRSHPSRREKSRMPAALMKREGAEIALVKFLQSRHVLGGETLAADRDVVLDLVDRANPSDNGRDRGMTQHVPQRRLREIRHLFLHQELQLFHGGIDLGQLRLGENSSAKVALRKPGRVSEPSRENAALQRNAHDDADILLLRE